jgi:hypothetical protein
MIDENNIKKNLEIYSFPRLSGSTAEHKAFEILKNDLKKSNLTPSIQEFTFSTFYSRVYPKIVFSMAFWLLFLTFVDYMGIFMLMNVFIISSVFIILFISTKKPENIKFGKVLPSQNITIEYPSKLRENSNKSIMLFAHLDSKGQRLSIMIRIWSFRLWLSSFFIGIIVLIFYYIIFIEIITWFFIICGLFVGVNFLATILIVMNSTNNKSNGASDNASGVVCVLELLKYYLNTELRLKNFNLKFVFTGAEECGTMGIRHFCNELSNVDKEISFIINFDAIGKVLAYFSSSINPTSNVSLYNSFIKTAKNLDLSFLRTKRSFGIRSDGLYLKSQGFRGFGFGDLAVYRYVHSVNDTVDKVDTVLLEKLCKFVSNVLKEIDNVYN